MTPLAIDLFCGLGGWTQGLLEADYRVVGFDIERHDYGTGGYPAQLVLQDVTTLHGSQFKDAALIVASPPCQAYSYRAMPWKRAKALPPPDNTLFETCFRLRREAIDAAGHFIPLVVENVCGAQKWVGRARWHYGSYYLWGDVPALMPLTRRIKNNGGSWFALAHNTTSGHSVNPVHRQINQAWRSKQYDEAPKMRLTIENAQDGYKQCGSGAEWWRGEIGSKSSKSSKRKAASAAIAKIPFPLAYHIAMAWRPDAG